jgi:hypothetical protein
MDPWIEENILPILDDVPANANHYTMPVHEWGDLLSEFLYGEARPRTCSSIGRATPWTSQAS